MDPTTADGRAACEHAFLSGGALGICGDFISLEWLSYGHGGLETILGPSVTGADHIIIGLGKAGSRVSAWATGRKPPVGTEGDDVLKALRNNTPLVSTHWALTAAFNRIILDQLSYLADSNAHRNMRAIEQRIKCDTNQGYWWRPRELTPDRLPEFTTGR